MFHLVDEHPSSLFSAESTPLSSYPSHSVHTAVIKVTKDFHKSSTYLNQLLNVLIYLSLQAFLTDTCFIEIKLQGPTY